MTNPQPEEVGEKTPSSGPIRPGMFVLNNTAPTDAERAAAIRAQLRPLLEQACEIVTSARRDGLAVSFNLTSDQFGIQRITSLDVTKPL